jgi:hypothetical protein
MIGKASLEFLSSSNNKSPNQTPRKITEFVGGSTTLGCQFFLCIQHLAARENQRQPEMSKSAQTAGPL